jgi:hypothetical protein
MFQMSGRHPNLLGTPALREGGWRDGLIRRF